jgi:hypothetical protein
MGREAPMRASVLAIAILGAVLAAAGAAANGVRNHPDPNVRFLTAVELTKGHFLASQGTYEAGQRARAAVHASHPSQELGVKVYGAPAKVSPELGEQVRNAMKLPGQAAERNVPAKEYAQTIERAFALLDDAVGRVIPAGVRSSPRFLFLVFGEVLWEITEEYKRSYSYSAGRIVQEAEYQDAVGFYRRARALYATIAPLLPRPLPVIERELDALGPTVSSFTPPPSPLHPNDVIKKVDVIMLEIGKVIGQLNGGGKAR